MERTVAQHHGQDVIKQINNHKKTNNHKKRMDMRNYLPPEAELLTLDLEQAIMTSSSEEDALRENYDVLDLFE